MRRDLKIGMLIGAVLVGGVMVTVAFWPGASIEARLLRTSGGSGPVEAAADAPAGHAPAAAGNQPTTEQPTPQHSSANEQSDDTLDAARWAVQSVRADADPATAESPPEAMHIHVVQRGQTLSHIAQQYYGSATQWRKIAEANKDVLPDPDRVRPGMRLKIPR